MRKTVMTAVFVLATAGVSLAQGPFDSAANNGGVAHGRAATFDDVLNVKAVGGATISPDGKQVFHTGRT